MEKTKEEILQIIKDAFSDHIFATAFDGIMGIETQIEGKEDFLKAIEDKITSKSSASKIDNEIKEKVIRLSELCSLAFNKGLDTVLEQEQDTLINDLVSKNIIKLVSGRTGFFFLDETYKTIFKLN